MSVLLLQDSDFVDRTTRAFSRKLSTQDTENEVRLLFYLQDTYGLKAARMANGTLHGNSASNRLDGKFLLLWLNSYIFIASYLSIHTHDICYNGKIKEKI